MSAQRRRNSDTSIDQQIEPYIEEQPIGTRLQETTASSLLLHLSADTPLELIGKFALTHDICDDTVTSVVHKLQKEGFDHD